MSLLRWFVDWLCARMNYVPKLATEYMKTQDTVMQKMTERIALADEVIERLKGENETLQAQLEESKYMDYKKIELENDRVRQEIKEMNEYYRKIQTEVSDILHGDKNFKFPYNLRLPGSTTLQDLTDDNMIHVCGRTGIPDTLRARFDNETSLVSQFNMMYNHLIQYKVINKMVDMIVQNGGLQLTVGYNEENTSGEIYYSMTVMKPEGMIIIKKDNEEG